ncbi:cysteine desulfurase [Ascosphaera pollenicola]|nr:cysteine desulfurase [Ascosphaera pollenicola]
MGKGTDKLYITHSEWASEDAYSASAGSNAGLQRRGGPGVSAAFRRLPFNYCALSLQPFQHPVCTSDGTIFDLMHIIPWLKKHGTNPVDGTPLKSTDLIKLNFMKNDTGEYVDPVTFKTLTNNSHIVAIKTSGNVFTWDAIEKLNIKPKMWRDLVSDDEFGRKDLITLQDPQNVEAKNLNSFKYLKDGEAPIGKDDSTGDINLNAMGNAAKILKAKEAVAKARAERLQKSDSATSASSSGAISGRLSASKVSQNQSKSTAGGRPLPFNAARYTTGKAAASFTSTGLTPHTSADLALLTDEQYMLRRGRVKMKGYAQIVTNVGALNLELHTEYAPKAVWNFIRLAKKGYYDGVTFHRNIKGFMIQGGDPTGTGRGGQSIWGKNFEDEVDNPLKHDARGTVSMANKGKDTNSSQFFVAYRAVPHLDRKHTIFARLIDSPSPSSSTLNAMEEAPVDSSNRPLDPITIVEVKIFVDPFEEFLEERNQGGEAGNASAKAASEKQLEDDTTTWTGKRLRVGAGEGKSTPSTGGVASGVGKYLKATQVEQQQQQQQAADDDIDEYERERARKKLKARSGGFGNFDSW